MTYAFELAQLILKEMKDNIKLITMSTTANGIEMEVMDVGLDCQLYTFTIKPKGGSNDTSKST